MRWNYDGYDESGSKNADSEDEDVSNEFLEPGSICAIGASAHSVDTVWFVKIIGEFESTVDVKGDYGHKVLSGVHAGSLSRKSQWQYYKKKVQTYRKQDNNFFSWEYCLSFCEL